MARSQCPKGHILRHVQAIRIEITEPITPRRTLPNVQRRILERLERIEALLAERAEDDDVRGGSL